LGAAAIRLGISGWTAALLVPLAAWLMVLIPWRVGHAGWTPPRQQRGMYRALAAWAITDVTVLLVFAR